MSGLIDALQTKDTTTDNGAITHSTSLSKVLDLFFIAGASREMNEASIQGMIEKAYIEDPKLTIKLIFWVGDIRGGGIGERRFFRIGMQFLNKYHPTVLQQVVRYIPEYTRWDNMFELDFNIIKPVLIEGLKAKNALLAKFLPRKKQYKNLASKIRKEFKWTSKQYRKLIVELSNTVEQQMSNKEWSDIKYESVPSQAMFKYKKAFYRNDEDRFKGYIEKAVKGETKINSGVLFPYQLYQAFNKNERGDLIEAQWNNLPNYMTDTTKQILPVCDVSGSMSGLPMDISVSLGVYISERNKGIFKDAFITFSSMPQLQLLKGNVCQRFRQLNRAPWEMNTDLIAVFDLILNKAKQNNLTQEEMPTTLLLISDMEFDQATRNNKKTNFEKIRKEYADSNYTMPEIVFWNVNGRAGNVPVQQHESGTALVSGASPSIVKSVLNGDVSPIKTMLTTLNNERYEIFSGVVV